MGAAMRWVGDLGIGGAGTAVAYRGRGGGNGGGEKAGGLGFVLDMVTATMAELGSVSLY